MPKSYTIAGAAGDLIEIIARLQALPESAAVNIPAYLRRDLLKWLQQNGEPALHIASN